MKPEQLKIIAIGMGYEPWICVNEVYKGQVRVRQLEGLTEHKEYNPLTNAEQCMEIMAKLKIEVEYSYRSWSGLISIPAKGFFEGEGQTINEAVCNTAYEYFNKCSD